MYNNISNLIPNKTIEEEKNEFVKRIQNFASELKSILDRPMFMFVDDDGFAYAIANCSNSSRKFYEIKFIYILYCYMKYVFFPSDDLLHQSCTHIHTHVHRSIVLFHHQTLSRIHVHIHIVIIMHTESGCVAHDNDNNNNMHIAIF